MPRCVLSSRLRMKCISVRVIIFSSLVSNLLLCNAEENLTAIAVKETFAFQRRYICEGVESFREFVQDSSAFVDKSLLLKEIFNESLNRVVTLNYPRDWGKSLNLNMIKTFLEIEVDKKGNPIVPLNETRNYRLFVKGEIVQDDGLVQKLEKPLLISKQKKIIEEYLGKRPVIFLNLTDFQPGTHFDHSYAEVVNKISDAFAEHEYMREVFNEIIDDESKPESIRKLAEKNLNMFEKILWKKGDRVEVQKSFNFLTEILTRHFKKMTFILVDGYDVPFNATFLCRTFPKSQEPTFFDFFRKFIYFTFVSNTHLKKAILTGILPLTKGDLLFALNTGTEFDLLSNTSIHKYYGFSLAEVGELYKLFNVDNDTITKTHQYYEGYAVGYPAREIIMEPLSIVRMVNTGTLKRADAQSNFISTYFTVNSIRNVLDALLSGLKTPVDFKNLTLNHDDFKTLQNAPYYNEKSYGPVVKSFMRYIYAAGTVTLTNFEMLDKFTVRFSTSDIFARLGEKMGFYYTNKLGFTPGSVRNISERFHKQLTAFIKCNALTSPELTKTLEEFFSHVFRPYGYITNENEEMTHVVMEYLTIFVNSYKRYPSYGTPILLLDQDGGVIMESTFNLSSAYEALQRAKESEDLFYPLKFPKMKYIGINAKPNATIQLVGM